VFHRRQLHESHDAQLAFHRVHRTTTRPLAIFLPSPNREGHYIFSCGFFFLLHAHHRTTFSDYIVATKACIDNRKKKLLKSNISSTPHVLTIWRTSAHALTAEIGWRVRSSPANFNAFCVLATLLSRFDRQHSTEGATYIRLGGHHVGHRPTFWLIF